MPSSKSAKKVMLTCYDATFAKIAARTKAVDYLLVGDSLGMVIDGEKTTTHVDLAVMERHTRAVRRGLEASKISKDELPFLITDLPAGTYDDPEMAVASARKCLEAGAQMVKVEGPCDDVVRALRFQDIRVCGHIGLTPQSILNFKVQGKSEEDRARLLNEALLLEKAGVELLVLEMIPADLARQITENIKIPTIGIGAGAGTSGQVLVIYDLLGLDPDFNPKFLKKFANGANWVQESIRNYSSQVKEEKFPDAEHSF